MEARQRQAASASNINDKHMINGIHARFEKIKCLRRRMCMQRCSKYRKESMMSHYVQLLGNIVFPPLPYITI